MSTTDSTQLTTGEHLSAGDFLSVDEQTGKVQRTRAGGKLIGIAKRDYSADELIVFPDDFARHGFLDFLEPIATDY